MDIYDPEKAIMMAMLKKELGNPSKVRKFFKKWIPEDPFSPVVLKTISTVISKGFHDGIINKLNEIFGTGDK